MAISTDHITGFAIGVGAAAAGFYVYKRNQAQVDAWLRQQGFNIPAAATADPATMSLENLVTEKERLEDLIAEREMASSETAAKETPEPVATTKDAPAPA